MTTNYNSTDLPPLWSGVTRKTKKDDIGIVALESSSEIRLIYWMANTYLAEAKAMQQKKSNN